MAVRLAQLSTVMGLDDEDEMMLWRYLAELESGRSLDADIRNVLSNLAEESPSMVVSYQWKAAMPPRFYTDKQRTRSRLGLHLKSSDIVTLPTPVVINDLGKYRADLEHKLKRSCFQGWFDRVTACLRGDGVNWEPPTDQDVELDLTITSRDLREHLRQFM